MAKKAAKPALGITLGARTEVLYAQVRPGTKEFFEMQKRQSGARSIGEYLDALASHLQEME